MSNLIQRRMRTGSTWLACCIALAIAAPAAAQTLSAPGLSAPGRISWDAEGVPTIDAANDNDAAFLQGYAHAKDRFFQMDLTRRSVSGTLAELVGSSQLSADVQARTLGLRRGAVKSWAAMSDDTRGWLRAYADGVNFWLNTNTLPPEYQALQLSKADPWTPVDSLCVGKGLAFQLSFDLDIDPTIKLGAYQQAGQAAGFDGSVLYFGDTHRIAPADDRVSIPGFQPGGPATMGAPAPKLAGAHDVPTIGMLDAQTIDMARAFREQLQDSPLLGRAMAGRDTPIGSNEWVIAGRHTTSGKPILANDPHLGLDLPSVFMEQHLSSRENRGGQTLDVSGVTVPGAPGVIQGCNQRLCWGTTTNSLDVTDVFQEKLRLNSYGLPYAIVHDGQEEPVQWIFQNYYVNRMNGTPNSVTRESSIGYTNGGVSVIVPRRNGGALASITGDSGLSIAYTGWGATFEIESFRRINRASNVQQFSDALTYFDFGSQNFAYADVDGNIAMFVTAEAPIRTDLQTQMAPGGGRPPWIIRDGTGALKHDWMPIQNRQENQAIPYEVLTAAEMPFVVNPASGYIANANNDPIGFSLDNNALNQLRPGGGLYYLDVGGSSAYRMGRIDREIQRLIASGNKISVADMKKLQANTQLLDAELVLPHLLRAYDNANAAGAWSQLAALGSDPRVVEAIARLRAWDYSSPTGIQQGYDAGDNPASLPAPGQAEINASVATTIWSAWRSAAIRNTIDKTLTGVGLASYRPGGRDAQAGFKFMLDNYAALGGKGASGLTFFAAAGAPDAAAARDHVLLKALTDGLDMLASEGFSAAFGGSTNQSDYRWGKLHRIVFDHPLAGPFNLPGANPYGFNNLSSELPGIARQGGFEAVDASSNDVRGSTVNGFMFGSGPARRFVGEMTPAIKAEQILPGGQSGVLGSPLYASQLSRWLTNQYKPMIIPASTALAQGTTTLSFQPR